MLNLLASNPKVSSAVKLWDGHLDNGADFDLSVLLKDLGLSPEELLNGLGFTLEEYEQVILNPLEEIGSGGEYRHFVYKSNQAADAAKTLFLQKHPDAQIEFTGEENRSLCAKGDTGKLFHYLDILQYSLFE